MQLLATSPIVQLTSQDGRAAVNDASRPNQQDQLHYLTVLFIWLDTLAGSLSFSRELEI